MAVWSFFIPLHRKVRDPFVETPRIFLCMQNIDYAEILAWKVDYYLKIISDRGLTFVPA